VSDVSITNSQVNKAGSTVRKWMRGEVADERMDRALTTIDAFRAAHQYPLIKANNGLRSMLKTERCPVEVSQRLKRFSTIIDKIVNREPSLALSKMQDVGGCRAILHDIDQIRRVEARLKKRRPIVGYSDYIVHPRSSGYRGVHVVVQYDDRCIEIQLRTRLMHTWAITVEQQSAAVGQNLKQDGDHAVQNLMAVISQAMAIEEAGGVVPTDVLDELEARRLQAGPYLEGLR
jgi:ppGpp synthetase/RelA/SpoT-type nucleotidyltranferase